MKRHFASAMNQSRRTLFCALVLLGATLMNAIAAVPDSRGIQFFSFKSLASFKASPGEKPGEQVFTSPEIKARLSGNELIASWNAELSPADYMKVELRAVYPNATGRWYAMGLWAVDPARHPRESVRNQKDSEGKVDTDTLILTQPTDRFQLRVALGSDNPKPPQVKFLSLSLLDNTVTREPLPPNRAAWGKTLEVPERSQMAYENGSVICSPTTVSMLLSYWHREAKCPADDHDVPEVVKGVFDPQWHGTGNWVFNTAYAGSFPGMRAYTARLSDVSELEAFIAKGIPVGLSVCYNRLRGKNRTPSGHLVVCVGFTENGDAVINDPGTSQNVRKIFPRANLVDAWSYSKNAVYLIYPANTKLPTDKYGHWESASRR